MSPALPIVVPAQVIRLWLQRQGLSAPRGSESLTPATFQDHLVRTGALQMDSVNVIDRAHYLTLWSRFGTYDRADVDRWVYQDQLAYEYWGHEASILPISHLGVGRRRMRRFPPEQWAERAWWPEYTTSTVSKRRVLARLRREGPLESVDFERSAEEWKDGMRPGGAMPFPKEDKRSLKLLWHAGRVAIRSRRHFRCVYDLAERVYPEGDPVSGTEYEDSWLLAGLSGNGVVSESHLANYFTGPNPLAPLRKRIIARNLRRGRILEVRVDGHRGLFYATPEHLEALASAPEPHGTHLICPFDSFLWQRKRALQMLGFDYKIEIYTPPKKRVFGYYVLPVLHDGRLVGRLDPKLHRDQARLEIRSIHLQPGFQADGAFHRGLTGALHSLATFLGAEKLIVPRGWRSKL